MMNQAKPRRSSFKRALFIPDLSRRMHFLQPQNLGNISHQFGDFQSWVISSSVRELLIRQALFVNLARAEVSKPLDGLKLNGIGTLQ